MNHGFSHHGHPSSLPYGVDPSQSARQGQMQPSILKPKRCYPSGSEREQTRANPVHAERAPSVSLINTTAKRRGPKQKTLVNQPQIEFVTMVEPQEELPSTSPKRKRAPKKAAQQQELVEKSPLSSPIGSSGSSTTREHPKGYHQDRTRGTMPHVVDLQGGHDISVGYSSFQMPSSYTQANTSGDFIHNQRSILAQNTHQIPTSEAYHTRAYLDSTSHSDYLQPSPIQSVEMRYPQASTKTSFVRGYSHFDPVDTRKSDFILRNPSDHAESQATVQPLHDYTSDYRHMESPLYSGNQIQEHQSVNYIQSRQEAEGQSSTIFAPINKSLEHFPIQSRQQLPFITNPFLSAVSQIHPIEPSGQLPVSIEPDPMMAQRGHNQSNQLFSSNLQPLPNATILVQGDSTVESDDFMNGSNQDLGSNLEVRAQEKELRRCKQERTDKGLKYLSGLIKQNIEETGNTTYEDVASALVLEAQCRPEQSQFSTNHDPENKNIRRRVYDALNVLIALGIIKKERKKIYWAGPSLSPAVDLEEKKRELRLVRSSCDQKQKQVQQLEYEEKLLYDQHCRNAPYFMHRDSEKVHLPFILLKIDKDAQTHIQMTEDRKHASIRTSLVGPAPVRTDMDILKVLDEEREHLSFSKRRDRGDLFANHHPPDTYSGGKE